MNNKLVNFGKYKNQPIEIMLEDTGYCNWVLSQEDMKVKYAWVFQAIKNAIQLEDTPEHNALQNRFLNKDYCIKLGNYFFELNKEKYKNEEQINYTDYTKSDMIVKKEIIEELSKKLTKIVLNKFVSLVPFFSINNLNENKEFDLKEYTKFYFEKYNLEEYFLYFTKMKNNYISRDKKEYEEKEKYLETVINKIKEDIFSQIQPLLSFKRIEEEGTYSFYFSLNNKFFIKFDCTIEKSRNYTFDISYETGKLDVEIFEMKIYEYNPNEALKKLIEDIENNNNTRNVGEPIFEKDNIDVIFTYYPSKKSFDNKLGINLKIELKPTISEDYPSILRKANKDKVNIVFCDNINSTSSTIEEIKKIYKQHEVDLITSSDLDTILLENKQNNSLEKYLKKIDSISINGKCDTNEVKNLILEFSKSLN